MKTRGISYEEILRVRQCAFELAKCVSLSFLYLAGTGEGTLPTPNPKASTCPKPVIGRNLYVHSIKFPTLRNSTRNLSLTTSVTSKVQLVGTQVVTRDANLRTVGLPSKLEVVR